jgi:FkbM family methyltransferase
MLFKLLKHRLKANKSLYRFYHFYITKNLIKDPTELILKTLKKDKAFIVQIGSNDGMTGDPMYTLVHAKPGWKALFVEPVPYLFERLKSNYSDCEGLLFENSAINDGEKQVFYWIDPRAKEENPNLPSWFDQLGSFKEEHVHGVPEIADILLRYRRKNEVQGITFQKLLEKHKIIDFDILHIDVEGYDWQVLGQVDLTRYQPKIILFEHKCLSGQEKELALEHVSKYYHATDLGADMFCVRK